MGGRRRAALALGLLQAAPAAGWSRVGHEKVNRIAEGLLAGKRRDQVRTLLHEDLFEAGGWEVAMAGTYPKTEVLHYHHQDPEWTCRSGLGDSSKHIQCDGHGAERGSLFCGLAYFFDQFAHAQLLEKYPAPKEPVNTPKELEVLRNVPEQERTATNFLRWLVILLGDLHQPLHWLRGEHDYGKQIKVTYKGSRQTLLEFWEEYLPRQLTAPQATALEKEFNERAMDWDYKSPPELFRDWAREAAEMACEIYQGMEVNHADGSRGISSSFELSEEMYQKWGKMWQTSVSRGGERIAYIMQNVLEHRRHHFASKEGRGHRHHHNRWKENLATNAAVAVLVVPGLLMLFRWHYRLAGVGGKGIFAASKDAIL